MHRPTVVIVIELLLLMISPKLAAILLPFAVAILLADLRSTARKIGWRKALLGGGEEVSPPVAEAGAPRFYVRIVETPEYGSLQDRVLVRIRLSVTCEERDGSAEHFNGWLQNEHGNRKTFDDVDLWDSVTMPSGKVTRLSDLIEPQTKNMRKGQTVEGFWLGTVPRAYWDASGRPYCRVQCQNYRNTPFMSERWLVHKTGDLEPAQVKSGEG